MKRPLLEIEDLQLLLPRYARILHGISFQLFPGETVGLIGESGCGKSMMASAILGLLPPTHRVTGRLFFEGQNLLDKFLPHPRGRRLSLILQDPALALNPLVPIGHQLIEGLVFHDKIPIKKAWTRGIEWLEKVGIREPSERMRQFPHQLSGGMKQRLLIAMALICAPSLLIADEPTTALDVTVQAQILELLMQLQKDQELSLLLITHDLGVIAHTCQKVMVMYAGQIVEIGSVESIFKEPKHPYTQALLEARRSLDHFDQEPLDCFEERLPLQPLSVTGCSFAHRCPAATQICSDRHPPNEPQAEGSVRCWKFARREIP